MKRKFSVALYVIAVLSLPSFGAFAQVTEPNERDLPWDRIEPIEREIIPYDHIRQADVFWHKRVWRIIDVREKMNLNFRYEGVDWQDMKPLITVLMNSVEQGEIDAYDEDNFRTKVTWDNIQRKISSVDTIPQYDLDGNYIGDTIVKNDFNPDLVKKFRLKEDWFFDEETSTMQVRIMAISPLYYDEEAEIEIPMFFLYYPKLREILVKQDAFNWKNDAVRWSWDDIFEMRYFSSYVWKESNVFDRRIQDYALGLDALRESERIKNEIFETEHDLWSF